jgi:proline iminopeptidase
MGQRTRQRRNYQATAALGTTELPDDPLECATTASVSSRPTHRRLSTSLLRGGLCLLVGCAAHPRSAAPSDAQRPHDTCSDSRLSGGGALLRSPDGVDLWYRAAGPPNAPALVYLHGGPGYNAYAFERSAGKLLEASFRMVYVDQRGCGRSGFEGPDASYGMQPTLRDLEQLRTALGIEAWGIIAHSFGAIVAAEYIREHGSNVTGVVLVDMSPEVGRVLSHHIDVVDRIADSTFPERAAAIHTLSHARDTTVFARLQRLYELLGRVPVQLHLHYLSPSQQEAMDGIDVASGLSSCTSSRVAAAYAREGYLDDRPEQRALGVPALLLGGRASEVVGHDNLVRAGHLWGAKLEMVEGAAHFIYFDQPRVFADRVTDFFRGAGRASSPEARPLPMRKTGARPAPQRAPGQPDRALPHVGKRPGPV